MWRAVRNVLTKYRNYGKEEEAALRAQQAASLARLKELEDAQARVEEMKANVVKQFVAMGNEMEEGSAKFDASSAQLQQGFDAVFDAARKNAQSRAIEKTLQDLEEKEADLVGHPKPPPSGSSSTSG